MEKRQNWIKCEKWSKLAQLWGVTNSDTQIGIYFINGAYKSIRLELSNDPTATSEQSRNWRWNLPNKTDFDHITEEVCGLCVRHRYMKYTAVHVEKILPITIFWLFVFICVFTHLEISFLLRYYVTSFEETKKLLFLLLTVPPVRPLFTSRSRQSAAKARKLLAKFWGRCANYAVIEDWGQEPQEWSLWRILWQILYIWVSQTAVFHVSIPNSFVRFLHGICVPCGVRRLFMIVDDAQLKWNNKCWAKACLVSTDRANAFDWAFRSHLS